MTLKNCHLEGLFLKQKYGRGVLALALEKMKKIFKSTEKECQNDDLSFLALFYGAHPTDGNKIHFSDILLGHFNSIFMEIE